MAAQHTATSHPWKPPLLLLLAAIAFLFLVAPAAAQSDNNSSNNNNFTNPTGNFNPSMAIVIVVLVSVFFFLGFFSIYVRQCSGDGDGGASFAARTLQAARSRRQRGLDPAVLETFPTLVYSEVKGLKIGKGSLECAVCLSEFEDDENLRLLPKCSHVFHPDCIDAWLSSHVTCPLCRANLDEPIEDSKSPAELLQHACGTDAELPPVQPLSPPPPPEQVVITVDQEKESCEEEAEDEAEVLDRIGSQRRQARAAATGRPPAPAPSRRFPRSHSTGHSLVQLGENLDRYTLRLPQHIRREILAASKLQRTKSFPANSAGGEGSVRRGSRVAGGGEGSSRGWRSFRLGSDRWPSFLVRTLSVSAWGSRRGGNGDGEASFKKGDGEGSFKKSGSTRGVDGGEGSVRGKLFDCLSGGGAAVKAEGAAADEFPTAPLARV